MTPMRVRVLDGETEAIIIPAIDWADLRERNDLTDADGDELRRTGRLWIGGGAAALYLIVRLG